VSRITLFRLIRALPDLAVSASPSVPGDEFARQTPQRACLDLLVIAHSTVLRRPFIASQGAAPASAGRLICPESNKSASHPDPRPGVQQIPISDPVFASADAREGAVAFAEKRAPTWRGR
jgi:enoyl-CoA hydratase